MINYENHCVYCPKELGCLGNACPNRNVPVKVCDKCKNEVGTLYDYDGEQLCKDCVPDKETAVEIEI